jgi:hypothetical protein
MLKSDFDGEENLLVGLLLELGLGLELLLDIGPEALRYQNQHKNNIFWGFEGEEAIEGPG